MRISAHSVLLPAGLVIVYLEPVWVRSTSPRAVAWSPQSCGALNLPIGRSKSSSGVGVTISVQGRVAAGATAPRLVVSFGEIVRPNERAR
jgi:hypothetical protein